MKGLLEQILRLRCSLEARIKELGGSIPDKWPHDMDGQYRNLQLLELVEDLEASGLNVFVIDENTDFSKLPPLGKKEEE